MAKDNLQNLVSNLEKLQIDITTEQVSTFSQYTSLLRAWNTRMNLTSSRALQNIDSVHFLDSATALPTLRALGPDKPSVLDVGTGAGFPGIPIKILAPEMRLTLLEATRKKTDFLREVATKLDIKQIEIINERAEISAHSIEMREKYDFILARAVGSLSTVSELSLPFCRVGGHVVAFKKGPPSNMQSELVAASEAIGILGGELLQMQKIPLPIFNDGRLLVIIKKVAKTPPTFPRRPGRPARTPIGQSGRKQP